MLAPRAPVGVERSPTGSRTAEREQRLRNKAEGPEYKYTSNAYAAAARTLGVGSYENGDHRGPVWLTPEEISLVREENYKRRLESPAPRGVPRALMIARGAK